jgi:hypothetical protein
MQLAVKVLNCCEFDSREAIKTRVECCLGRRGDQRHRAPTVQRWSWMRRGERLHQFPEDIVEVG